MLLKVVDNSEYNNVERMVCTFVGLIKKAGYKQSFFSVYVDKRVITEVLCCQVRFSVADLKNASFSSKQIVNHSLNASNPNVPNILE